MAPLILMFACLLLGKLSARFFNPPLGTVQGINWWVMRVALPALVLEMVPKVSVDAHLWFPVASMWVVFFGAWLLFAVLGRWLGWSPQRVGAMTLVAGLGNTAFMGYPMIQAMRGKEGLALAVVSDQLGCFPLLASAGVLVASLYAGREPQLWPLVRRVLTFPSFVALVVGVVVGLLGGWSPVVSDVLHPVGATMTPLALFSVGMQFRLQLGRAQLPALAVALGWKLLLAPLLCLLIGWAGGVGGLTLVVGVLQAAMAPMISAAIMADEYGLEPALANTILGAGIVLSLLTIPLANALFGGSGA